MAKRFGCVAEYAGERMDALMREYEQYISSCEFIFLPEVCRHIVNRPCRRFWVSGIRAAIVIAGMLRTGDKYIRSMRPTKREMFQEIYRRVLIMRRNHPSMSLSKVVEKVIESPAPKFYLSPDSAKIMICKAKKEWYARKKRKHQPS